jgi:hypothetical protein
MMGGNPLVWFVVLVLISTVVGAVAKMLNNLSEANAARRAEEERRARADRMERAAERAPAQDERAERPSRPVPTASSSSSAGGSVRPTSSDMDRFLAEIDRLRRKQTAAPEPPVVSPGSVPPVAPVVQPVRPAAPDRPRPRVVAELADAPAGTPTGGGASFGTSPQAPTRAAPVAAQVEELPVAQVQRASSATGAPATKVTRFFNRPRPASRTNFGKNLTALLASGQGVAMAVVLQEILGPPKAKKNANAEKQDHGDGGHPHAG